MRSEYHPPQADTTPTWGFFLHIALPLCFCGPLRPLYGVIGEMSTPPRMLERTDIFLGDSEGCRRQGDLW